MSCPLVEAWREAGCPRVIVLLAAGLPIVNVRHGDGIMEESESWMFGLRRGRGSAFTAYACSMAMR